jgi:hypothetical protein
MQAGLRTDAAVAVGDRLSRLTGLKPCAASLVMGREAVRYRRVATSHAGQSRRRSSTRSYGESGAEPAD